MNVEVKMSNINIRKQFRFDVWKFLWSLVSIEKQHHK